MKDIVFNPGDLLVGPAGKIVLITKLEIGAYTFTTSEFLNRIFGYINGEKVQSFVAYENDIKSMIIAHIWKHYRVVE